MNKNKIKNEYNKSILYVKENFVYLSSNNMWCYIPNKSVIEIIDLSFFEDFFKQDGCSIRFYYYDEIINAKFWLRDLENYFIKLSNE